jgi:hypothetical protein
MSEEPAANDGLALLPAGGELGGKGRLIAMAAGDLLQTMFRETRSLLQEAGGDRFDALKLGLVRLRRDGLVNQRDLNRLEALLEAARTASEQPLVTDEVPEQIRSTYHTLVADGRSSSVALAIGSLGNSLVTPTEAAEANGTLTFTMARGRVEGAGAVLTGAMIGAGVGGEIGGLAGAGIGVIVGGVVGAVMGECEIQTG